MVIDVPSIIASSRSLFSIFLLFSPNQTVFNYRWSQNKFLLQAKTLFCQKNQEVNLYVGVSSNYVAKEETNNWKEESKEKTKNNSRNSRDWYSSLKKARLSDGNLVPNHGYWAVPILLNVHRAKFLLLPILFEVARRCQEVAMQQVRGRERSDRICSSRLVLSPCSPTGRQDERQTGITGVYIVTRIRWPVFTK